MNGWLCVAAAVTAVDVHAGLTGHPTLSATFRAAANSHPVAIGAATVYLLAHLFGVVPAEYDPLTRLGGNR